MIRAVLCFVIMEMECKCKIYATERTKSWTKRRNHLWQLAVLHIEAEKRQHCRQQVNVVIAVFHVHGVSILHDFLKIPGSLCFICIWPISIHLHHW